MKNAPLVGAFLIEPARWPDSRVFSKIHVVQTGAGLPY